MNCVRIETHLTVCIMNLNSIIECYRILLRDIITLSIKNLLSKKYLRNKLLYSKVPLFLSTWQCTGHFRAPKNQKYNEVL